MKTLSTKTDKKTRVRTVTVELAPGERLIAVQDHAFYELGEPLKDVVQGHIIADAVPVHWCVIGQKFIT
jgi:hypothetical protein